MQTLQWISVIMALVLGLGITRLLTAAVGLFKARRRISMDWLPLAWAAALFVTQLQFWWALGDLAVTTNKFPFLEFVALVTLPLMLFLTAALLLPFGEEPASLRAYFEADGKWALVALSLFFAGAFITNWKLFEATPVAAWGLVNVLLIALPLIVALSRSRTVQAVLTLITVPLVAADTILASYWS